MLCNTTWDNRLDIVYPVSGFVVGAIVGLTGVGGGALMTPLLILAFGFSPVTAVGTDLLYACITKSAGTLAHLRQGNVDWRTVRWMSAGSLPTAAMTVVALHAFLPDTHAISAVLSVALGCALLATAAALLLRERIVRHWPRTDTTDRGKSRNPIVGMVLLGAARGILVTLSSVGAGALGTVALLILFPRMPTTRIVGTDIAHAVPVTLVAGLGHAALGTVNWTLLASLLVGSIPGIWLGSQAASRVPEATLRTILATLLAVAGLRFFV